MSDIEFYRARVREAQANVEAATLANVRTQRLHALAAWQRLADRAEHVANERLAREAASRAKTQES